MTGGSIRLDGAPVRGNGTVLEGSLVETAIHSAEVILKNGVRVNLAAQSRARLFEGHVVLEQGAGEIHAAGGYSIQANSLSIVSKGQSAIRVIRTGPLQLQVSAVVGQVEVENVHGALIATVVPGSPLEFHQQAAGAAGATRVSGRLEEQSGAYSVADMGTKTRLEVQGESLDKAVGQCISGEGSSDPGNARLIHLAFFAKVSCKKIGLAAGGAAAVSQSDAAGAGNAGAGTAAAGGVAGGAAAGGLSAPVVTAIVVGGAVAGTLGGVAAAGVFSSGPPTPVSAP